MTTPSWRLIAQAIAERLAEQLPDRTGYHTRIGRPLVMGATVPTDPPLKADGRTVAPYLIFTPGAGGGDPDPSLSCGAGGGATIRVTAVAGDPDDLLALVDRIHTAISYWRPVVDGLSCSRLTPPPGFEAPVLTDPAYTPERLYVPLQYQFTATT